MNNIFTLDTLDVGSIATVVSVGAVDGMRRRLFDLGVVEGTSVECVGRSPFSDPSAYFIRGAVIALRRDDSRKILVKGRLGNGYEE